LDKKNINDHSYYRVRIHRAKCPICAFTSKIKEFVNKKIIRGDSIESITDYILKKHPIYDEDDRENFNFIIRSHAEYLELLLEDILTKSMFKSIRESLKDVDLDDLKMNDKVKLIKKVEDDMLLESDNLDDEKLSISKSLVNETLPLLIGRFNKEIKQGVPQSIKLLSNSLSMTLDSITELNKKPKDTSKTKEEDKEVDGMELLEIDSSRKEKIVSLSDRIQQAVGSRN
jgi:hypothetical protein